MKTEKEKARMTERKTLNKKSYKRNEELMNVVIDIDLIL